MKYKIKINAFYLLKCDFNNEEKFVWPWIYRKVVGAFKGLQLE